MAGKCPKCNGVVHQAVADDIRIKGSGGVPWLGLAHLCPHCSTILGMQIDPIALKSDILNELLEALRKG